MSSQSRATPAVAVQRSDPPTTASREALERAKNRASSMRPEAPTGTPRFDEAQDASRRIAPAIGDGTPLSPKTIEALKAAAAATAESAAAREEQAAEEKEERVASPTKHTLDSVIAALGCDAATAGKVLLLLDPTTDSTQAIRRAIEKRLRPMDIGQYLMNGSISQEIEIVPKGADGSGLRVTLQSLTPEAELFLEQQMSAAIAAKKGAEMARSEYERLQTQSIVALYIFAVNDKPWPPLSTANGSISADAFAARLNRVKTLPAFPLILQNISWFVERMNSALEVSVLGNG